MASNASTSSSPVSLQRQKSDEYAPAPVLRPRTENNVASRVYSQLPPVSPLQVASFKLDYDSDLYLEPVKTKEDGLSLVMKHEAFRPVDRVGAKELLQRTKCGTYLLRRSGEEQFLAILTINGRLKIQNVPIWYNKSSGQFYLDTDRCLEKQMFKGIDTLLRYYSVNAINGDKLAVDNENNLPPYEAQE